MQCWESVKELQLLCERVDFKHIYSFKKLTFLYKLAKLNRPNICLKVCFAVYKWSTEFNSLCTKFVLAFNLFSFNDVKCKVYEDFVTILLYLRNWVFYYTYVTGFYVHNFS